LTSETLDKTTLPDREPPKKSYVVERPRFPLVFKLFGLTALLILIVVGIAVGITIQRANSVSTKTVNESIAGADGAARQRAGVLRLHSARAFR
jgi:hypothetical protein